MKNIMFTAVFTAFLLSCQHKVEQNNSSHPQSNNEMEMITATTAIETMLSSYRDALNTSDVSKVLPLYTQNGVFMPSHAPTAIGEEQVKVAYEFVFAKIQLTIEFFIDEIVIDGNYAFVRTNSKGTTLIHASGETVPEVNRELFVLQQEDGAWKIARYMFNKME